MQKIISGLWFLLIILLIFFAGGIPIPILIILLVLAFAYPVFREFRKRTEYDERQIQISRFSSHITMYLFTGLVLLVMIHKYLAQGLPLDTDMEFYMLLLVPLTVKMLINVFQKYEPHKAAAFIAYLFGGGWMLYNLFSYGISMTSMMQSIPFFVLMAAGLTAKRLPWVSGIIMLALGITALVMFFPSHKPDDIYGQIMGFTLVPFPFMLSGCALIVNKLQKEPD